MYQDSIFEQVKARVSMRETAELMGFEPKHGFIRCPFHADDTASLKLYQDSFYCYGCNTGGDAIKFVQLLKGYSRAVDAAKELARAAGLTVEPYKPNKAPAKPAVPSAGQVASYLDKWETRAFRAALWAREECSVLLRTYTPETVDGTFHDLLRMREQCERLLEELTAGTVAPPLQERAALHDYWKEFVNETINHFEWGETFDRLDRNFKKSAG